MSEYLRFVKLSENATTPTRATAMSAGLDLYSVRDYIILPKQKTLCCTDICIMLPDGCYGRIAPRSGMSLHHHVHVGGNFLTY
jgi:dUTP pyrophosphatase